MKSKAVKSTWLRLEAHRLDPGPFMSGAIECRAKLKMLSKKTDTLTEVTLSGGIYNGPQFSRKYVYGEEFGVRFMGSSPMMQSDLSNLPRISNKSAYSNKLSHLQLSKGMTLISCSGTIGRTLFVNKALSDIWTSQHVMKVCPDPQKIGAGYLYAFISSKYGVPLVVSGTYGAIIKHIEPEHIAEIPIPRFEKNTENIVDTLIEEASELRAQFQEKVDLATDLLFKSAGLKDITAYDWHANGPDTGFSVKLKGPRSIRALNFNSRYQKLLTSLSSVNHKLLGEICNGGQLQRGGRFKRVDADPEHGIQLIGQKQGFWTKPEGRWIAQRYAKNEIVVDDETVLIASQGTLGEREVFCRPVFATGQWLNFGFSEHFLRVNTGDPDISGAYLFAFLRSETAFRCLRSMSIGSKQQDIHVGMLAELPIPIIDDENKEKVETLIREAFKAKDLADRKEQEAIAMVESAIDEAALL